ncbi:BTAD domain-containing putative transcriptional regulator [Asanoa iriomotensis]|uniref:SARP family transcriptional regulator n=1 Tax=Asanoa iriomotensis TaxID=234613 RepID=A0ABQ4BYY6_9ACTN|nr:SARP family transcriptional regulator [Asanoa iriomotensis]
MTCDGRTVDVGTARKPRLMLAVLLSRAGTPVSVDSLVAALWGDDPPVSARRNVQLYVHRLRRTLGADRVVASAAGYALLPGEEFDAATFRALAAAGNEALLAGNVPQATRDLRTALDLWRGPVLPEFDDCEIVAEEARRLEQQRLSVYEQWAQAALDLGGHADIASELTDLVHAHPYRESLRASLMLALYRTGRQAEALELFRATRALMDEQLGVEPSPALQRLHAAMLRGDSSLVPGRTIPAQLPADISTFGGRSAHLRRLDNLLPGTGHGSIISTITGTAGVGKTTLAVHWAHRVGDEFPDGQLYLNLRGFDPSEPPLGPDEAVRALLDGLGVPADTVPAGLQAQTALFRSATAGKRLLVLLDNAVNAEQVRPLLPAGKQCLVLVTSRHDLAGLVATEGAHSLRLDLLSYEEARQFLSRRLGAGRVAAEPDAVNEIVAACARLPLALAVVAARATSRPDFPLAALVGQLHDGLEAFAGDDAATDVRAVLSWSYRSLSTDAASLFRLFGLHRGPDVAAAGAASLAGAPLRRTRALLAELTRAHLVTERTPGRYGFHDLLRAYAGELAHTVDPEGERNLATRRMLDHYLCSAFAAANLLYPHRHTIATAPPTAGVTTASVSDHDEALAWFAGEHTALMAAARHATTAGHHQHAWQLAWALGTYLDRRGHWLDKVAVMTNGLAAAERSADRTGQAVCHHSLGIAYNFLDRFDDAHRHYRTAGELFRRLGDDSGLAHNHLNHALVFERQGLHTDALRHAQESLDIFVRAGHRSGQAKALNAVGWFHAMLDEYEEALHHCTKALELVQALGDRYGEAATWDSLAYSHHRLHRYELAASCYQRSIDLWHVLGDPHSEAAVLDRLADNHEEAGDLDTSARARERARAVLDAAPARR